MRQLMAGIAIAGSVVAGACTDGVERLTMQPSTRTSDVAAAADPGAGTSPNGELILNDLQSPRGLAFGPGGALYVAEAGPGGKGTDPHDCFIAFGAKVCYDTTGAVTRLWHGQRERVATGLPSWANLNSGQGEGPNGISIDGLGNAYVTIGLEGNPHLRDPNPRFAGLGQLVRMLPAALSQGRGHGGDGAQWEYVADLGTYELGADPDCGDLDSNPFGVLAEGREVIIADAGANTFVRMSADGTLSNFAVFSDNTSPKDVTGCPQKSENDFVPTSIVRGPDGAYYLGHLNGLPIHVGGTTILRMEPGGEPQVYLTDFTWIEALAFDASGNLFVLQHNDGDKTNDPGSVIRVAPDGTRSVIVSGIQRPGGMTVDEEGRVYISTIPGKNYRAAGQVRRYTP